MKLVVGLGNPDEKYRFTRHNAGFLVVDKLALDLGCPKFGLDPKLRSEIIGCRAKGIGEADEPVLLVKPQTYMNSSGEAVSLVLNYYKDRVTLEDLWVIHDDVDLSMGRLKIQRGGATAGHHGLESIVGAVGASFVRFRFGVGRPGKGVFDVEDFVLQGFLPEEKGRFEKEVVRMSEAVQKALGIGLEAAMAEFNTKE